MDCSKCHEGWMEKTGIIGFRRQEASGRILIYWEARCPECGYTCEIEEEFAPTDWEMEC